MLFLIDYDRIRGQLVQMRSFDKSRQSEADQARLELELRFHREGLAREVVILEASSEEAMRKTHRRYFEDLESIARLPEDRAAP